MGSMNRVFLMGNLTRDPEVKQTTAGTVVDLGMAISDKFRNKEGKETESVCFVDLVVWGRQAEACGEYLAKGSAIMVEGSLVFEQWATADGQKRSKLRVRASRVQFLGRPKGSQDKGTRRKEETEEEGSEEMAEPAGRMPF